VSVEVVMNQRVVLASRPEGMPRESDFRLESIPMPEPGPGEVLVRGLWLSVDPYVRGLIAGVYPHLKRIEPGETIRGGVVGEVMRSIDPAFRVGDIVEGRLGWQRHGVLPGSALRVLDPSRAPVSTALGVLGMPGMTAYFGLLDIGEPKAGQTVVVSAAAGAVGSAAGQIARIHGCRVVGIAGGAAKARHVVEDLGFDACIDYKAEPDLAAALRRHCPDRIDIYFDNVGGSTWDAATTWMALDGRIVICGSIAEYNESAAPSGPRRLKEFETWRMRMQGFRVGDYIRRYPQAREVMEGWIAEGRLRYRESVAEGLASAPSAFIGLLEGRNLGKQLVRLAADQLAALP
jgi:NADPH-dependent curcumin reductase CurA